MNELFGDPFMCNDLETLRSCIIKLQELALQYRGDTGSESKLVELLYRVNSEQGERIDLLAERIEIEHQLTKVYKERCEKLLEQTTTCSTQKSGFHLN